MHPAGWNPTLFMDDISNMIMHCSTISRQYEQIINLYGVNRYSIILLSLMFATVFVVIYSSCKHFLLCCMKHLMLWEKASLRHNYEVFNLVHWDPYLEEYILVLLIFSGMLIIIWIPYDPTITLSLRASFSTQPKLLQLLVDAEWSGKERNVYAQDHDHSETVEEEFTSSKKVQWC